MVMHNCSTHLSQVTDLSAPASRKLPPTSESVSPTFG
jgi:hypothetical protein